MLSIDQLKSDVKEIQHVLKDKPETLVSLKKALIALKLMEKYLLTGEDENLMNTAIFVFQLLITSLKNIKGKDQITKPFLVQMGTLLQRVTYYADEKENERLKEYEKKLEEENKTIMQADTDVIRYPDGTTIDRRNLVYLTNGKIVPRLEAGMFYNFILKGIEEGVVETALKELGVSKNKFIKACEKYEVEPLTEEEYYERRKTRR